MTDKHDELINLITEDHKEVKGIFAQLEKESEASRLEELVHKLNMDIKPHIAGEEESLYPALMKTDGKEAALEAIEEHQVAKKILQELIDMSGSQENFKAKVTVLRELVYHHIEEEEDKIFSLYKDQVTSDQAEDALNSFQATKKEVKEKMKELAPA